MGPGRYMPVRVTAQPAQRLWIDGNGIVPVAVHAGGLPIDVGVSVDDLEFRTHSGRGGARRTRIAYSRSRSSLSVPGSVWNSV